MVRPELDVSHGPMTAMIAELSSALYLAADEADVADDFLRNLVAPSGPDVVARNRQRNWAQRFGLGSGSERISAKAIPQGDQLRRTLVAVDAAIAAADHLATLEPPPQALHVWDQLLSALEASDLHGRRALVDHQYRRVTANDIGAVAGALRRAAAAMAKARLQLTLIEERSR